MIPYRRTRAALSVSIVLRLVFLLALGFPLSARSQPATRAEVAKVNDEGVAYFNANNLKAAEERYRVAIDLANRVLGQADTLTLLITNNLAFTLMNQRRFADAETYFKRILEFGEPIVAPDDPRLAQALNNLGLLYVTQARFREAEGPLLRSLEVYSKRKAEDSGVSAALFNLGRTYTGLARFTEANDLLVRAANIRSRIDGPNSIAFFGCVESIVANRISAGQGLEALALAQPLTEGIKLHLGPNHPLYAESMFFLAWSYAVLGRYTETERIVRQIIDAQDVAKTPDAQLFMQILGLGGLYRRQGRISDALRLGQRALEIAKVSFEGVPVVIETARLLLAMAYLKAGQPDQAEPLLREVIRRVDPHSQTGIAAKWPLAIAYRDNGRLKEARSLIDTAIEEMGRIQVPNSLALGDFYLTKGTIEERANDLLGAEISYRKTIMLHEATGSVTHPNVVESAFGLARLYRKVGQIENALKAIRVASNILSQRQGGTDADVDSAGELSEQRDLRAVYLAHLEILDQGAAAASDSKQFAGEGFVVAQSANLSAAGRALGTLTSRLSAGTGALSDLVRQRQDAAARVTAISKALLQLAARPAAERSSETEASLKRQVHEAQASLDAATTQLTAEFPKFAELSLGKPLHVKEAQDLLDTEEALLTYIVGDDRTYAWVVKRDDWRLFTLAVGLNELGKEISALRSRLDPGQNPDLLPFDVSRSHALYQRVVAPLLPAIGDVKHVLVVADGPLESFPFGLFVTEEPGDQNDYRKISWMARRVATTVLPAVSSLRTLRLFQKGPPAPEPFIGIGDPILEGKPGSGRGKTAADLLRGGVADVASVRRMARLPETALELKALAQSQGATDAALLLGEQATEARVKAAGLDRYQTIAIATHGLLAGAVQELTEPALVLTPPAFGSEADDGLLTASEIAQLKLNADWVIASACNTASDDGTPGAEGLSGLARAFFYAGSRTLLVSHWPVLSQAAVKLTTGTFAALKADPSIGKAEALRRAEMAILDDPSSAASLTHPAAWAPFIVVGEGAPKR